MFVFAVWVLPEALHVFLLSLPLFFLVPAMLVAIQVVCLRCFETHVGHRHGLSVRAFNVLAMLVAIQDA